MLTITINPGGRRRVVPIAEALHLFGLDTRPYGDRPIRTPDERRRRKLQQQKEYRGRVLARERGLEQ